jgi:hypothetical protein
MFQGFNIKYPEYEVITPQTGLSFNVRSLNVQEEERLKGSLLTPAKINEHLNKCLFDACAKKPKDVVSYDDFLKKVTLKDRDALLYGLYHITYEEIRNYDVSCSACSKDYPITIKASDTFGMNAYPGDDILTKSVQAELPISKGVFASIKQPTLFDEMVALKSAGVGTSTKIDILTETLIIQSFQQTPEEGGDTAVYSDREDVIDAYRSLPAKDKRSIYAKYRSEFGQYGITLKMITNCAFCAHEEELDIDLVENFFRMVHSV